MNFNSPNPEKNINKTENKKENKQAIIAMAMELSNHPEPFRFPGANKEFYDKQKAEEAPYVEQGYVTSIDDVIARIQLKGMKISLGKQPEKGEVFILPFSDAEVSSDSMFLHQVDSAGITDTKLGELMKKVLEAQTLDMVNK